VRTHATALAGARTLVLAFAVAAALASPRLAAQAAPDPAAGPATGSAQYPAEGSADWYDRQARTAIERHGYEAAAKLLGEAKRAFPDDTRFNLALASLYYDEELWRLALDEYVEAERKGVADPEQYARIARCLGKLDRNREAVGWLERATEQWPGDAALVDDLGWMYFKVHRYADGVQLLLAAVQDSGMSSDLAMTLGTLYSGMGDYAESSRYYRTAIELSAVGDSRYFASIAWYNLSLLERRFYHYRAALQATDESLAAEDLASGHLARGELLESRMDYRGALAEYEAALAQDDTPLAKVSLAVLHRRFGRLDLAERYAAEALAEEDPAWLLYYGSDVAHYRLDVHESLADIHEGIARLALGRPTAGLLARCRALLSAAGNALQGWYHRQRARLYAAQVGRAYLTEGAEEDGAFHLANATEAYPRIALKYLERARAVETARAPQAEVLYRIDEGSLRRSAGMIREAIEHLDPVWERLPLADALIEIVPLAAREGDRVGRREAVNRLFKVNPGALAPEGLGVPLVLRFAGDWTGRERRTVRRLVARSGSELAAETGGGFRYVLTLERSADARVSFTLVEGDAARAAAEGVVEPTGGPRRRAADVVAAVLAECYAVE
jgi:tetratricopeptide (TPR) repeat protein